MLIAITLISGLSLAEDANVSNNESEIATAEVIEPTAAEPSGNESAVPVEAAPEEVATETLEGSWILTLDGAQVSMVLRQSGVILFGAANSESPKPWNGVVSGSLSDDVVNLRILSLQDGVLVSTLISGIAQDGAINDGYFARSDSQGNVDLGTVTGILTSPDTTGYEPADVPTVSTTTAPSAAVTPATENIENATTTKTTEESKSYTDVSALADQMFGSFKDPSMPI